MVSKDYLESLIEEGKNVEECCSILEISRRKLILLRKEYGLSLICKKFNTTCEHCNKKHEYLALKEKNLYFCSVRCSLIGRKKSNDTKNKISEKLKKHFSDNKSDKFCLECNENIKNKRSKAKFCSRKCFGKYQTKSDENRSKLSQRRIKYLENSKHVNWFDTYNINGDLIKVQGNWEKELSTSLNRLGILYTRKSVNINKVNKYTPDFYLPHYKIFIEVKGFLYDKDKYKMLKSIDNNKDMDLRIIFDIKEIKKLEEFDINNLYKVEDVIKYDNIDFSKFTVRY